ncbi:unnamed protein product [Prunus armeniaca]|uniref:Uncharacterized protein n=1 Tax=Prunus armeniaca TaxID=36596 RepID=A0A6J5WG35_PRUAR|nr:unnamed protein product [Prunus armeniaca]
MKFPFLFGYNAIHKSNPIKYTWQDFGAKLQEIDKPSSDCLISDCEEFKAMWRLVDEMTEKDYTTTA